MTASAGDQVLEFDGVTKWYGSVAALLDISFRIGCEIVGLVGKNGVGKTTLLKLGVGLLRPSQGRVRVAGLPATARAARGLVGFCPDFDRLFESLSGLAFVAWLLRYHGIGKRQALARAGELLGELGLTEHMQRPIREYSKGMRQRVRLAQALAHRPRFVLLDEPMTGLDPVARSELATLIRAMPPRGVGVLVSSHVLHELEAVANRVVLVHQGRLMADGRVDELRAALPATPHRVRIVGHRPRELAAQLIGWPEVDGVSCTDDNSLEVALSGQHGFYRRLTELGAAWDGGLREVTPLDDDLAAVFGYLVE